MIWALARKDLLLLWRDRRAVVVLLAMPILLIFILGISLGEGFGHKPDDRLRVSLVVLDRGLPGPPDPQRYPPDTWSKIVERDLAQTAGIKVELIPTREESLELVRTGQRAAVLVLGPEFSERMHQVSFLAKGINPFYRDGIHLGRLDVEVLRDPTQFAAASIIEQVLQVTIMRVTIPWMIGRAFESVAQRLGKVGARVIQQQMPNYDFSAKTWAALCREPEPDDMGVEPDTFGASSGGVLKRGSYRYQILVPSYTVMFMFFIVLTYGWMFSTERTQGTLRRLKGAPVARTEILLGKLVPCFILSAIQGILLLLAGKLVFGMSFGPDPKWVFLVALATSAAATGLAMLAGSLARSETQVMIVGTMLVLAMAGLSGCLMPRELMPEQTKVISRITPHAWALDAFNQLLLNPEPNLVVVAWSCGALTLFGLGYLLLATLVFRLD